jgi:5-formyltetrahydrofolate cyclo-ligase
LKETGFMLMASALPDARRSGASEEASAEKARWRKIALARRDALSAQDRAMKDTAIARALITHPWWREASLIALYAAIRSEAATATLISQAFAEGKRVALPRVNRGNKGALFLAFHELRPGQKMEVAVWGIEQPPASAPLVEPDPIHLWIVPCAAFDAGCGRIGYGKGLYDQALRNVGAPTVAIAYDCQEVECAPMTARDVKLGAVLTESGWRMAASGGPLPTRSNMGKKP